MTVTKKMDSTNRLALIQLHSLLLWAQGCSQQQGRADKEEGCHQTKSGPPSRLRNTACQNQQNVHDCTSERSRRDLGTKLQKMSRDLTIQRNRDESKQTIQHRAKCHRQKKSHVYPPKGKASAPVSWLLISCQLTRFRIAMETHLSCVFIRMFLERLN